MQLLTNLYELKEPAIQLRLQVITDYDLGVLSYYVYRRRLLFTVWDYRFRDGSPIGLH